MHKNAEGKSREERVRQVENLDSSIRDYASYIPVGNSVEKLKSWQKQGAEILYLSSHETAEDVEKDRLVLEKYDFPKGQIFFRQSGESYKGIAEKIIPDVLIEDDCESIGGEKEMTITFVKPEIRQKIKSVVIKEFGGVDHLPDDLNDIAKMTTNLFRTEEERKVTLTQKELEKILGIDPSFQSISEAAYFDNYDLPCPVRVSVTTKDNKVATVVLRKNRHGDVRKEIQILRALKEFGLPVPEILCEPFETENDEYAAIYSLLPGENLQKLSMRSESDLVLAKNLLVEAVVKLMDATDFIRKHEVSKILPSITLTDELEALNTKDNPWLVEKIYQDAIQKLQKILSDVKTPLVLSNGDYQPGNFLTQDGKITGFLDFESPSFQDPMMGFVKYPIYDLDPLGKTDIVKVFLDRKGFSEEDFNYRLVLGCLKILKKEIPLSGGNDETQEYRNRVLGLLKNSSDLIN